MTIDARFNSPSPPSSRPLSSPGNPDSPQALFHLPIRIYYEDTDAGGVVYYANYLNFLERCRTECLRSIGIDQADLLRDTGIAFVVRHVSIDYLKPAKLDDLLHVTLRIEKISRAQLFFQQTITRQHNEGIQIPQELIRAQVHIVAVDMTKMKPVSLPPSLRSKLESFQ